MGHGESAGLERGRRLQLDHPRLISKEFAPVRGNSLGHSSKILYPLLFKLHDGCAQACAVLFLFLLRCALVFRQLDQDLVVLCTNISKTKWCVLPILFRSLVMGIVKRLTSHC